MKSTLLALALAIAAPVVAAQVLLEVKADANGLFYVPGAIGVAPLRFLIDTGATEVTVPRAVANRAGEYGSCKWVRNVTANGVIDSCMRKVSVLRLGSIIVKDADVLITTDESVASGLLGMSVLRLFRVEIQGGVLRISQ